VSAARAREVARVILTEVRVRGSWAHETAQARIASEKLDARDAALATRLAYGAIASAGTLDEVLDRFLKRPSAVEPKVRDALRIAAYEALFARTPEHVVVSEGVELVKSVAPRAAALANAVLRRLVEGRAEFPWGDPANDPSALARLTGHPAWMVELAVRALGDTAAREMLEADNSAAPLYLALNPFAASEEQALARIREDGAEPEMCSLPGCVRAGEPGAAVRGGALREGLAVVCDAAAQAAVALADPRAGQRVVEIGAGRGTKSLLLQAAALRSGDTAEIVAVDVYDFKVELLEKRMQELHVPGVTGVVADARNEEALAHATSGKCDIVFVDAPCTGLGTLRRHPDKRWRLRPEEVGSAAALGAELLASSATLVRPGGVVVYSTCTIAAEENEAVVSGFLGTDAGSEFGIESACGRLPEDWDRFLTSEGFLRSWPTAGGPDGHFAARLVKR
jgi:16S rRNA (cytosine967-C5)-methyltransferase